MGDIDFVKTDCYDLACHTGVTFLCDCQVIQDCSELPDNLTDYSAVLTILDTTETDVILTVNGVITEPLLGVIHFEIAASATATLALGIYKHHIQLTTGSTVYRLASGLFEVSE